MPILLVYLQKSRTGRNCHCIFCNGSRYAVKLVISVVFMHSRAHDVAAVRMVYNYYIAFGDVFSQLSTRRPRLGGVAAGGHGYLIGRSVAKLERTVIYADRGLYIQRVADLNCFIAEHSLVKLDAVARRVLNSNVGVFVLAVIVVYFRDLDAFYLHIGADVGEGKAVYCCWFRGESEATGLRICAVFKLGQAVISSAAARGDYRVAKSNIAESS